MAATVKKAHSTKNTKKAKACPCCHCAPCECKPKQHKKAESYNMDEAGLCQAIVD